MDEEGVLLAVDHNTGGRGLGIAVRDLNGLAFAKELPPLVRGSVVPAPEEFLRTLVEAEIASRDESNVRTGMRQAAFPVARRLEEFDVAASSIPWGLSVGHQRDRNMAIDSMMAIP